MQSSADDQNGRRDNYQQDQEELKHIQPQAAENVTIECLMETFLR